MFFHRVKEVLTARVLRIDSLVFINKKARISRHRLYAKRQILDEFKSVRIDHEPLRGRLEVLP